MRAPSLTQFYLFILTLALLGVGFAASADATSYWVSPTGSNGNNGLSPATAWRTLDNGELTAVIAPGDTVNILPGSYAPADPYLLTTSGTAALPIVYRKSGKSQAIINGTNASGEVIEVDASHIVISGLWIIDAKDDAIVSAR